MLKSSVLFFGALSIFSGIAYGVQFTATSDICIDINCANVAANYSGANAGDSVIFGSIEPTDLRGVVADGGNDAFDEFGYVANVGSFSLDRQTELLSGNIYRFFDTYTNTSNESASNTVTFAGDFGSDTATVYANVNPYRQTSSDGGPGDPVVGFIWGNNDFAAAMVRSTGDGFHGGLNEKVAISATLNLAPGQTVSLMYFAFLANDLTDRSGDNALALSTVNSLFGSPDFSGLSSQQQAQTLNWGLGRGDTSGVPEPSTALLTVGGLAALFALRRRR